MLALTRKIGERIVIDNQIVVTVVEIRGESVRLGIEAPNEIKIYRGELYDAIVNENREAVASNPAKDLNVLKTIPKKKKE
ncbi:MAG TPA: carbon storage regulator CsrA [Patescibacteria group bacterium]|nr:carbon storage regulator CsrA [Patescibacteria group bacterium]